MLGINQLGRLSPIRKRLPDLQHELLMQHDLGRKRIPRQEQRIDELRQKVQKDPQSLSQQELSFLDAVGQQDLRDAQLRRAYQDAEELRQYQIQEAQGVPVKNMGRFEELLKEERGRRNSRMRQDLANKVLLGTGIAGVTAAGAGAATAVAAANGALPFTLGAMGGDEAALVAQTARIERELEERAFQDELARRTSLAQNKLDNDLMSMQQKALFEQNLANSIQRQQASAMSSQGGVDVLNKITARAAEMMAQGVEPAKAFTLAQTDIRMDGSAQGYL